jgi:hypothetical protein
VGGGRRRHAEEVSVGGVEPLGVLDVGRCGEPPPGTPPLSTLMANLLFYSSLLP